MKPEKANIWFKGAFILTIGALITKILSAIYRVPFQNIVGDTGFYIYQQVYPFYGIIMAVSTYGFPVVISKIYMEMKLKGDKSGMDRLVSSSFFILSGLGILSFVSLFFGADQLARFMGDPSLASLIRVISFTTLLFPFVTVYRGIFQGEGEMIPIAFSQVGEQFIRVVTILMVAFYFSYHNYSLYIIGSGAMFGSVTGGLISFLLLYYYYKKKNYTFRFFTNSDFFSNKSRKLSKRLLYEGLTISISSMLLLLLQAADSLSLYSGLIVAGISESTAKTIKGVYDRGQPLIQMGTIISTSMALTLVPMITGEKLHKEKGSLIKKIRFSLLISMFIGLGASVGLMSLMRQVNIMLFKNADGTVVLAILSLVILFNAIITACTAILQGLGYTLYPAVLILFGVFLKYCLNLLFVPMYGTLGASIATNLTLVIIMLFMMKKLMSVLQVKLFDMQEVFPIMKAAIVMFVVLKIYLTLTEQLQAAWESVRILSAFQALTGVFLGGIIYVLLVVRSNILKEEEWLLLPFGSKLTLFIPKK